MDKGQTLTVSAIFMVLVIITLVSGILFFGRDVVTDLTSETEEDIEGRIDERKAATVITSVSPPVSQQEPKIGVKNIGKLKLPIENFRIYLNDTHHNSGFLDCGESIEIGEECNMTVYDVGGGTDICNYDIALYGPHGTWDTTKASDTCT